MVDLTALEKLYLGLYLDDQRQSQSAETAQSETKYVAKRMSNELDIPEWEVLNRAIKIFDLIHTGNINVIDHINKPQSPATAQGVGDDDKLPMGDLIPHDDLIPKHDLCASQPSSDQRQTGGADGMPEVKDVKSD